MNPDSLVQTYATPYKYGKAVIEGSGVEGTFDYLAVDCPFVFRRQGKYFMILHAKTVDTTPKRR